VKLHETIGSLGLEEALDLTSRALDYIGDLTGNYRVHDALMIVHTVQGIYQALTRTVAGDLTAADVHDELAKLEAALSANDDAADDAVGDKFGSTEE
jgi:hypothetical protein